MEETNFIGEFVFVYHIATNDLVKCVQPPLVLCHKLPVPQQTYLSVRVGRAYPSSLYHSMRVHDIL